MTVFHNQLAKILKTLTMGFWVLVGADVSPSLSPAQLEVTGR